MHEEVIKTHAEIQILQDLQIEIYKIGYVELDADKILTIIEGKIAGLKCHWKSITNDVKKASNSVPA